MRYRNLGAAGIRVSELALGNWVTHGGQIGDEAARECVHAALDHGINFFDTADVYENGRAESVLGEILKDVPRKDYVLATKCFFPTGPSVNDRGLSRKHIMESCHASLERLQTDHIDLYQAHRFDRHVPLEETLRAWDDLVRQGKVNYIGVSEWNADQIGAALQIAGDLGLERIVTNQPQYSMLWRVPETEVMPLCRKEGIGQIVWSPLAMGVLTGKYKPGERPPADSRVAQGGEVWQDYMDDETLARVQQLRPIADDLGMSMAVLALAWVLQNDNVSAAIVGASRGSQITENAAASGVTLPAEVMQQIDRALEGVVFFERPSG